MTTEALRRTIQHSQASLRALSKRYGINRKTVVKWRQRTSVADQRSGPKDPRKTVPSLEDEAIVVAFRRPTLLPLDDCLDALQPTIPHLTRSSRHSFVSACSRNNIDHRLTQPRHLWTNSQVERMNRLIKEAAVKRYHCDSHQKLGAHLVDFVSAYNLGRRLKTLRGLTSYEAICKAWSAEPGCVRPCPLHHMPGPNMFKRYRDRVKADVFAKIFAAVSDEPDLECAMVDGTIVKFHRHAQGVKGSGRQAIGKSRVGWTTKILALTDALGNLVRFTLLPSQRHDTADVAPLIEGIAFRALIADKAFDAS